MKFTHLHIHTHYSLLDGLAKIDDILDRAKELGMDSLALTDHGVLYGAIEFFIKAKEKGIKPIIGCEMYLTAGDHTSRNNTQEDKTRYHLILLCKNKAGYKNLMKLISIAHLEGFYYKPRVNREILKKYSEGLIALSACVKGEVPAAAVAGNLEKAEALALEYQNIFGKGNFYLEIQHHPKFPNQAAANNALIEISKKHNIPLVATNDIHYIKKEDAEIHDILLCIQTNRKVEDQNRMNMLNFDLWLKSPEEMRAHFAHIPEALENTQKIVEQCQLEIKLGETQLPHFDVPEGKTPESYLRELTEKGLREKFGENITQQHKERMEYELGVIEKTGFASYFLIVADFVNWAKSQGIVVGPGRGSAAGSFVSYLTGITNIDPIKYDLIFERFLNPERISMPDVDMDFADTRRDEVLDYVRKKYGNDHVAQIITFGTMAARAAIRDAGRALNLPYSFCDQTAKMIPMFSTIPQALENTKEFSDLYKNTPDGKKLIDSAARLEGVARHASMHACGVVITPEPVTEYTPLQKITKKGKDNVEGTVTQYSSSTKSSYIEKIGLLKMDFLGLKNLTIIQNTLRIVRKIHEIDIDIEKIPLDDKKAYELLQNAQTTGVFQLESSGMKRYLKLLAPNVFEDIIAMVALYRPGPMDWIPDFIARKHGEKQVQYLHPKLKPILEKTYGIAVYQEQVMQIAQALAGFSLSEADVLRKAMGKKIFALIQEEKKKFVQGCIDEGIAQNVAEKVFSFIEPFAGYGFNRCLTGDTLITDAKNGKQSKMKELYDKYSKREKLPSIFTLDNKKLKKVTITKVFNNGKKEVFRITTRLGKSIEATSNHPFLAFSGWQKLEELRIGDRIALNRNFPISLKKHPTEDYKLTVLGYLMAEGNLCHPQSFYFYSANKDELRDYRNNLEKFNNTKATINDSKSAASVYAGRIDLKEKSEAVEWIKSLGIHYHKAVQKELPEFVFSLNNDQLSLLIGKMFQGDGCVNLSRKYSQIFYATSSPVLATQLQHLLLRLDIISSLHRKKFKYRESIRIGYTLSIDRYTNIFNFSIGPGRFLVGEKAKTLKRIISSHAILNGKIKTGSARGSNDVIPCEIKSIITSLIRRKGYALRPFAKKHNLAERLLFNDKKKKGYLRETVLNIGKILKSKELIDHAESDIYWDEIVSIDKIGIQATYDLTIDGTHNFIANDFIVHNSHAACYALIGYQTAYLKAHYPAPFMAALLTSDQDNIDRVAIEVSECREMGIEVLPPDVNESFEEFAVITNDPNKNAANGADNTTTERIRFGLNAIKNVGHTVAKEIVEERKRGGRFKSLTDLIERVTHKDLNKKSLEALAKVGALDGLAERNQVISSVENIISHSKKIQAQKNSNQISLFGQEEIALPEIQLVSVEPASKKERLSWEKELLGLYISDHPVKEYREYFRKMALPIRDITPDIVGQNISIGGVITKIQKIILKNKNTMLFVTVEDTDSKIEILVFPKVLETTGALWQEDKIILASGRLSDKDGAFKLLADSVKSVNQQELENFKRVLATQTKNGDFHSPSPQYSRQERAYGSPPYNSSIIKETPPRYSPENGRSRLLITFPANFDKEILKTLSAYFDRCDLGAMKVYLQIGNTKLETPYCIKQIDGIFDAVQKIVPEGKVEIR